jgi:iron complex transport system substrate-binding protein
MLRVLLAVLACVALSAGCSAPAPEPEAAGATIAHRYGTTTVPADPQRVATVGFTDHDAVLALGVTPVAYTSWLSDAPLPWQRIDTGPTGPARLDQTAPDFEAIAAAAPDLILAVHSALTQEQYDTLSGIAPTVAQSGDHPDFGTPWQEQTRTIGTALGRAEQADALVTDVESRFAAARAAHPEFAGVPAVAGLTGPDGTYYAYGPADARAQFLAALGFTPSQEIAALAGDSFFTAVSAERFDLLADAGALLWITTGDAERTALEQLPAYAALPPVQQGRDVFPPYEPLGVALTYNTVLSLPYALDGVLPQLSAAVDGDPATTG